MKREGRLRLGGGRALAAPTSAPRIASSWGSPPAPRGRGAGCFPSQPSPGAGGRGVPGRAGSRGEPGHSPGRGLGAARERAGPPPARSPPTAIKNKTRRVVTATATAAAARGWRKLPQPPDSRRGAPRRPSRVSPTSGGETGTPVTEPVPSPILGRNWQRPGGGDGGTNLTRRSPTWVPCAGPCGPGRLPSVSGAAAA